MTDSKWVREEIQLAATRRIGMLGVIWPKNATIDPMTSAAAQQIPSDRRLQLAVAVSTDGSTRDIMRDAKLADDELAQVDHLLFTGRSQAIASRVRDLVDSVSSALPAGLTVIRWRDDGDLELSKDGAMWFGCVVPFRPDAIDLWSWWQERRARSPSPAGIVVLYPQLDPSDPDDVAFRAVCEPWCASVGPRVVLCGVHV